MIADLLTELARWFPLAPRPCSCAMGEEPVSVTDGLHAASEQTRSWEQAVERAERGETVAVLAHSGHVGDVVPLREIERLRETIDASFRQRPPRELRNGVDDLRAGRVVPTALMWPPT
jgi:antitoxin (DNA-binding transcriptional repressor) of toxin-antitoxin stability system